jgi:hypothetical protein
VADETRYATVYLPQVEHGKAQSGTYYGGKVWAERSNDGDWMVVQELESWEQTYLLIARQTPDYFNRDIRLYKNVPEGALSALINEVATDATLYLDEVRSQNSGREGVHNVYMTVITGLSNDPVKVGKKDTDQGTESELLYANVKYSNVDSLVSSLAVLGSYAVVEVDARRTQQAGVFDLFLSTLERKEGGGIVRVGMKKTKRTTEETWKHPWIAEDELSAKVAELADLSGRTLVDVDARATKWDGLFDVYLTYVTAVGASDVLLVGTKKTEETTEYTYRHGWIAEANLEAKIGE